MVQTFKFQPAIAVDAGIWGPALLIAVDKRLDHLRLKICGEIKGVVGNPKAVADTFCIPLNLVL